MDYTIQFLLVYGTYYAKWSISWFPQVWVKHSCTLHLCCLLYIATHKHCVFLLIWRILQQCHFLISLMEDLDNMAVESFCKFNVVFLFWTGNTLPLSRQNQKPIKRLNVVLVEWLLWLFKKKNLNGYWLRSSSHMLFYCSCIFGRVWQSDQPVI